MFKGGRADRRGDKVGMRDQNKKEKSLIFRSGFFLFCLAAPDGFEPPNA